MRHSTAKVFETGLNKMPIAYKRAHQVWCLQRGRCQNPNNKKFKHYGAKGIRVEYSSKDFVEWYVKNHPGGERMHVGRRDHSKNYRLDNIEFQTAQENGKEVTNRCGPPKARKRIDIYQHGVKVGEAASMHVAAIATKIDQANIHLYCTGKYKISRNGFTFRYHEGVS